MMSTQIDPMIDTHTTVIATEDHVSSDLAGETVILNMQDGTYYGLNETGTRVWELLGEPRSVEELQHVLLDEYDVSPEQCMDDLLAMLRDMEKHDLVRPQ